MIVSKTTGIFIFLGLLVLAAAAYLLFGKSSGGVITAADAPSSAAEVTFLSLTAKIDPVEFDTSILEDPRFKRLRDIRTAIIPEATGRPDPFAPLSGGR